MTLGEIRRRPTLPGRFQPSTISVLRLNFCVRDGNRWIPQAIVTGKERGSCLLLPRSRAYCFRLSHPQNRTGSGSASRLTMALRLPFRTFPHKSSRLQVLVSVSASVCLPSPSGSSRPLPVPSVSPASCSLFPFPWSPVPLPRSSPRPISIIKLHTLPHFHR